MKPITTLAVGIASGFALGVLVTHFFDGQGDTTMIQDRSVGIGIPEFVDQVRDELISSELRRIELNKPALFTTKNVQLEISFVARRKQAAGAKVALEVVELNAIDEISNELVQKMTLTLEVQPPEKITIKPSL